MNEVITKDKLELCTFMGDKRLNNVIKSRGNKESITKNEMYRKIVDEYFEKHPINDAEKELYFK